MKRHPVITDLHKIRKSKRIAIRVLATQAGLHHDALRGKYSALSKISMLAAVLGYELVLRPKPVEPEYWSG